jgi:hypothetical protein
MENIEKFQLPNKIIPRDRKVRLIKETLSIIKEMPDMVVSGSFSLAISNNIHDGKLNIDDLDLDLINDLDIGSVGVKTHPEVDTLIGESKEEGFEIDNNPFLNPSLYSEEIKAIAFSNARILFSDAEFLIKYTTPAFLLMSVSGETDESKVSSIKRNESIKKIMASSSFLIDDFIELANYEIKARDEMNIQTFDYWKKILTEENKMTDVKEIIQEAESISSLVDITKLIEALNNGVDFSQILFSQVRKKSGLELFLENLKLDLSSLQ